MRSDELFVFFSVVWTAVPPCLGTVQVYLAWHSLVDDQVYDMNRCSLY